MEVMARSKPLTAAEYAYTILLQPEAEGGYTVTAPALPGLVTYGEDLEDARRMAAEAIEAYLESLHKDGEPIPASDLPDSLAVTEQVRVRLEPA
jgi:predicted RNase H-like HicB family nuclease